ncbi:MAG: haloacid dehalogenase [Clostridia bacterium]|nr:haloacid dehalogenase [Clostridia bacterium]
MKKILFACDLDNTLIHSARKKQDDDICIEWIGDKPQSFIAPKTVALLKEINREALFLPITTRSIEQYLRIQWPEDCQPHYAITTNGGVLLTDGKEDATWGKISREIGIQYQQEFARLLEDMQRSDFFIKCRTVDGLYLFGYCKDGVDGGACQVYYREKTLLNVMISGRKLYIFPSEFQKGNGLMRFQERFAVDAVYCAGDSIIDVSMLALGDISYVPNAELSRSYSANEKRVCPSGTPFSEFIVHDVVQRIKEVGL